MCGIFAYLGRNKNDDAARVVLDGLKRLEYRGYDSWGIAEISDGNLLSDKHVGKIGTAKTSLPESSAAIGHTRWATHGGVTDENAHPFIDCKKRYAVVHNGIVENHRELHARLEKGGHTFSSQTDSEVIAHLLEEIGDPFKVFGMLEGSNAVAILDSKTGSIFGLRNGSPLVFGAADGSSYFASDVPAFLPYTNRVCFMKDGEGIVAGQGVKTPELFRLKDKKKLNLCLQTIDWKAEDAERGSFDHFMLKEIYEQRETIPKTALLNKDIISGVASIIKKRGSVVIAACGTAYYCAVAAKNFFARAGVRVEAHGAYEFLPFVDSCEKGTVFIAVSQSGETADTLIAAREAKKRGAHIVSVVNARGSTLERMSDSVLPVGSGPEIAVVSTKAFTAQVSTLYLLAEECAGRGAQARRRIVKLGSSLAKWLSPSLHKNIVNIARRIQSEDDIYVIGKHINHPSALECALKIKESSYIHAEAFAAGELKHGVITLIRKGSPCIALFANDNVKSELCSSAAELAARGGWIIGVGPTHESEWNAHIKVPDVPAPLSIFPNVIVGQLLGYSLGLARGVDPDKPRNLAKSVTVK